jgi:hypothetical protein
MLLDEAGGLQDLFHETVGHRHAVLALGNLVKVAHVKAAIPLAVHPQHVLDGPHRHPPDRRPQQALVHEAGIPMRFVALAPAPQRSRRPAQDVPARNQCSSPLSAFNITSWTVIARSHAASGYPIEPPQLCGIPAALEADRSLALRSGQIMYSLQSLT